MQNLDNNRNIIFAFSCNIKTMRLDLTHRFYDFLMKFWWFDPYFRFKMNAERMDWRGEIKKTLAMLVRQRMLFFGEHKNRSQWSVIQTNIQSILPTGFLQSVSGFYKYPNTMFYLKISLNIRLLLKQIKKICCRIVEIFDRFYINSQLEEETFRDDIASTSNTLGNIGTTTKFRGKWRGK